MACLQTSGKEGGGRGNGGQSGKVHRQTKSFTCIFSKTKHKHLQNNVSVRYFTFGMYTWDQRSTSSSSLTRWVRGGVGCCMGHRGGVGCCMGKRVGWVLCEVEGWGAGTWGGGKKGKSLTRSHTQDSYLPQSRGEMLVRNSDTFITTKH